MANNDSIQSVEKLNPSQRNLIKVFEALDSVRNTVVESSLENCKREVRNEMYKSIGEMMCTTHKLQQEFIKYFESISTDDSLGITSECETEFYDNVNNTEGKNLSSESGYNSSPVAVPAPKEVVNCKKPTINWIEVNLLTDEEFKKLPKYMVGRIALDSVNRFITEINTAVRQKYTILSKRKSELKAKEYEQYLEYKHSETDDLKGKTFLLESDIAAVNNRKKFDKSSVNMIVILRHLKRIIENRSKGGVKYMII